MKSKQKTAIQRYFADYTAWLIIVAVMSVAVTLLALLIRGKEPLIWVIPAGFALIWLCSLPVLLYYIRVMRDWKAQAIGKAVITVADIQVDDTYAFKSHGVARMSGIKYELIDREGKRYLLCADEKSLGVMHFFPELDMQLEVVYLERSKLILRMRILKCESKRKKDRRQQWMLEQFKGNFRHYLE
jgi:hypothetical protein